MKKIKIPHHSRKRRTNKKIKKDVVDESVRLSDKYLDNLKKKNCNISKIFYICKSKLCLIIFLLISILLNIIILILFLNKKSFNYNDNDYNNFYNNENNINEPKLPLNPNEIIVKDYYKTKYDSTKFRYHYQDLYNNRTLFKINYSYLPYTKIDKTLSYEENAKQIFESTGMLNMTLLNYYYNNSNIVTSKFNNIHVSVGMDANFMLVSLITLASLLNNSSPDTFIHLHTLLLDSTFEDIQHIYNLQKINKNVEFIFYNAKQAEYDFERGKKERRGIGDYTRVLLPNVVNNTNRVIIIDSGDIFVNKDLSELYFFDIEDNYFVFSLDDAAGHFLNNLIFARNHFYPNTGVCLVNVRKFREDNLYRSAFFASIAYSNLPCPYQDIFLVISNFKFKFWPLNYNCPQFYENDEELKERNPNTKRIKGFMDAQQYSPFKYTLEEIIDAATNPVINHLYLEKPMNNNANKRFMERYREYAKMTGLYDEFKKKYPNVF